MKTVWAGGNVMSWFLCCEYSPKGCFQAANVMSLNSEKGCIHHFACYCELVPVQKSICWEDVLQYFEVRCGNCSVKNWWIYQGHSLRMGEQAPVSFPSIPKICMHTSLNTHTHAHTYTIKLDFSIDRGRLSLL